MLFILLMFLVNKLEVTQTKLNNNTRALVNNKVFILRIFEVHITYITYKNMFLFLICQME